MPDAVKKVALLMAKTLEAIWKKGRVEQHEVPILSDACRQLAPSSYQGVMEF